MADCSAWTLTMSLPALMKSATLCSGSTIILQGIIIVSPESQGGATALYTPACCQQEVAKLLCQSGRAAAVLAWICSTCSYGQSEHKHGRCFAQGRGLTDVCR